MAAAATNLSGACSKCRVHMLQQIDIARCETKTCIEIFG